MFKNIIISFAILALLAACTSPLEEPSNELGYINSDTELFHDFGDINIEGELLNHSFTFTNEGEGDLRIIDLITSCMCTEAEVLIDGDTVSPGENFEVLVTYDPMAHGPNATGEMNRSIILTTTSEENGRLAVMDPSTGYSFTQMNIRGMVLSLEDYLTAMNSNE